MSVYKCSPVEMRKNMEVVDVLQKAGIDFVAIPVKSDGHKNEMIAYRNNIFEELLQASEEESNNTTTGKG